MKRTLLSTILVCAFIFCANAQTATRQAYQQPARQVHQQPARQTQQPILVQTHHLDPINHRNDVRIGTRPFTRYAIGIEAGTYGGGLWLATNLSNHFALRAGFNYFGLNFTVGENVEMRAYHRGTTNSAGVFEVDFGAPRWRMPHGRVMVDWFPVTNGVFSLTLGTYIGAFDFIIDGQVEGYNPNQPLSFNMVDRTLNPRDDGTFSGRLRMGNLVKPYFGIGLGRSIPNSRVGFRFDLGVAYQGRLQFISEQATIGHIGEEIHSDYIPEGLELISTIADWMRFWPVMNFSLTIRL